MKEHSQQDQAAKPNLSRRDFMRGIGGGALALGAGQLLAGCGGSSGGAPGGGLNVPFTLFISTFLARSVLRYDSATGNLRELVKFDQFADPPTNKKSKRRRAWLSVPTSKVCLSLVPVPTRFSW